jgi:hypothetical protein
MTNEILSSSDLQAMRKEKGNICVSIVVPTHRLSPERRTDRIPLERAIDRATQLLYSKYPEVEIKPLQQALEEMFRSIDFSRNADGIGLFLSPHIRHLVQFPFAVEEKVIVGDSFEMRDLLYKVQITRPYFALQLNEKGAWLFEGTFNELYEINNEHFPQRYEEEYTYQAPSRSTSYSGQAHVKSFEKDKSVLEEVHYKNFLNKIDKMLGSYLAGDVLLFLSGVNKKIAQFLDVSSHTKKIAGKITGNYNHRNQSELADAIQTLLHSFRHTEQRKLINEFREKIGESRGISGIQDIWSAAKEGKALLLLLEKDYRCPGFLTDDEYQLYLQPPVKPHRTIADAADDLMEMVLEKNGRVFFTDNGLLKEFNRVALITRY